MYGGEKVMVGWGGGGVTLHSMIIFHCLIILKINACAMKHTRVDTMAVNTCRQYNKIDN